MGIPSIHPELSQTTRWSTVDIILQANKTVSPEVKSIQADLAWFCKGRDGMKGLAMFAEQLLRFHIPCRKQQVQCDNSLSQ